MFKYILAIDPGVTTGYALSKIDYDNKSCTILNIGEFQTWERFDEFFSLITNDCCIAYEGFRFGLALRQGTRAHAHTNAPSEAIGVLRYLANKHNIEVFEQLPHERKVVDMWYKELKTKFPSHAGDAVQHNILRAVYLCDRTLPQLIYNYKELYASSYNKFSY